MLSQIPFLESDLAIRIKAAICRCDTWNAGSLKEKRLIS